MSAPRISSPPCRTALMCALASYLDSAALAMAYECASSGKKGRMVALSQVLWVAGGLSVAGASVLMVLTGNPGTLGARVLLLWVVLAALIVLALRSLLPESLEWETAVSKTAVRHPIFTSNAVRFERLGQVFRRPLISAVLALGLYYSMWTVGVTIYTRYGAYIWTTMTSENIYQSVLPSAAAARLASFTHFSALGLTSGLVASLVFTSVVDTKWRRLCTGTGTILIIVGWVPLALAGASEASVLSVVFLVTIGSSFAGEPLYKVWAQEHSPTLLRGTSQGITMASARIVAAVLAGSALALLKMDPSVVFVGIFVCAIGAGVIWLVWAPRLPRAQDFAES